MEEKEGILGGFSSQVVTIYYIRIKPNIVCLRYVFAFLCTNSYSQLHSMSAFAYEQKVLLPLEGSCFAK